MNFLDEYFSTLDIDDIVPRIRAKYREQLCLPGCKIEYKDFTKFIRRGREYFPKFVVTDKAEEDVEIEMYPLLCVGMAEFLTSVSGADSQPNIMFFNSFSDETVFSNIESALKLYKEVQHSTAKNEKELLSFTAMKAGYMDYRFPIIRELVSFLGALYLGNPSVFSKAAIHVMRYAYTVCSIFLADETQISCGQIGEDKIREFSVTEMFSKRYLQPKRVGYSIDGVRHYITDSRGVGIYVFLLLMAHMFKKFGEPLAKSTVKIEFNLEMLNKKIFQCLGDDWSGRYYKEGHVPFRKCEAAYVREQQQRLQWPLNSNIVYKINGKEVSRDEYDCEVMYKHATVVAYRDTGDNMAKYSDCMYANVFSIQNAILGVALSGKDISYDSLKEVIQRVGRDSKRTAEIYKNLELERISSEYTSKIAKLEAQNQDRCNDYEKQIALLKEQLQTKSRIIEDLNSEKTELCEKISSYYDEADYLDISDIGVGLDDMVSYLNNFSFTLVGGYAGLGEKLQGVGLTGVVQYIDDSIVRTTPSNTDFICICTRFISHQVVKYVESYYKNKGSEMFYFNGTNKESFIRVSYDFVKGWIGE